MLLVCSKSTRRYFEDIENVKIISSSMTEEDVVYYKDTEEDVIAVGGGAVIDAAKVICKNPIICYPTTAAGASNTSHSVYWNKGRKFSIKRHVPKEVHVVPEMIESLPEQQKLWTTYDALSHCLDSSWNVRRNKESLSYVQEALEIIKSNPSTVELVKAGNIAGKAIEISPTTILHSMSYPLTGFYNIPHGRALGYLLPRVCKFMDVDLSEYIQSPEILLPDIFRHELAKEAMTYKKIYDIDKEITLEKITELY